jgi:signal transduction histidine kinase
MSRLRGKLLLSMLAIVIVTVALSAVFTGRVAHDEMRRILLAQRTKAEANPDVTALEAHYRLHGSWTGVQPALDALGRRVILTTRARTILATSDNLRGARVQVTPDDQVTVNDHGRLLLLRFPPVFLAGGACAYVLPDDEPSGRPELAALDRRLLFTFGAAAVIAILMALVISRRITQPVERLTAAVHAMAGGSLQTRVPVQGRDELAQLATAFNSMADALAAQQDLRQRMVSDVAHELRTPLTNLRCELEAIQDGLATPDAARIASIHEEVLHLGRLVDDLQQLALAEAGGLRLNRERIDLGEAVARAIDAFPHRNDIALSTSREALVVSADVTRLGQIVRNLLANAIQHTREPRRIAVELRRDGEAALVSVSDNGPGIPAAELENIFERFYRVEEARDRDSGGAGLGLPIAQRLAELHGGSIRAENRPEGGARFVVSIPLAPS